MHVDAYIGLGSNLHDPVDQVTQASEALKDLPETKLITCSPLYRSKPMGPQDQPDYINAVAAIKTRLSPLALLDHLQGLEQQFGRKRGERWGPRVLDLDLLLYGDQCMASPRLTLPHPGLHERNFVLYPLQDVAPELDIPGLGPIHELIQQCSSERLEPLKTC